MSIEVPKTHKEATDAWRTGTLYGAENKYPVIKQPIPGADLNKYVILTGKDKTFYDGLNGMHTISIPDWGK